MTPKEQVETIMDIFKSLNHGEQVDLFQEIKAQLIDNRKRRYEEHASRAELEQVGMKILEEGNRIITGNVPVTEKASY